MLGNCKPPSRFIIGLVLLTVALAVAVAIVFAGERKRNPFVHALTGGDLTESGGLVGVQLGDVRLNIPREYFFRLPAREKCGPDKEALQFLLLFFLPNFGSVADPANRIEFSQGRGPGRSILMLVEYGNCSLSGAEYARMTRSYYHDEITNSDYGYKRFGDPIVGKAPGFEYLFKGDISSPNDFTRCDMKRDGLNPSCSRYRLIGNDIVIHYSMSRSLLERIDETERSIIFLLNSFRASGPELKVIQ